MQSTDVEYLNGAFTVSEQEPSTFAEVAALIGEDEVVAEAVANLRYRNKYPRVYRKMSEAVANGEIGFRRAAVGTKSLRDGTVKDILESEMDHLRAYLTGRKDKNENWITPAPEGEELEYRKGILQSLFNEIATTEPLYVKGERTGGGGKISQAALDNSNGFFSKGEATVEKVAATIEAKVPGYHVGRDQDGDITVESLARGIMALNKHIENQAKLAAKNELANLG